MNAEISLKNHIKIHLKIKPRTGPISVIKKSMISLFNVLCLYSNRAIYKVLVKFAKLLY